MRYMPSYAYSDALYAILRIVPSQSLPAAPNSGQREPKAALLLNYNVSQDEDEEGSVIKVLGQVVWKVHLRDRVNKKKVVNKLDLRVRVNKAFSACDLFASGQSL